MQTFSNKVLQIAISDIVVDLSENVRDFAPDMQAAEYNLSPLVEDIATYGQTDPVSLEKREDGKFYPIRGFRRVLAIKELATANRSDPKDGNKPFSKVAAYVFQNLSAAERAELLVDHGQRKGLGKVGMQLAYEKLVEAGMTNERLIVVKLYTLLEQNYPPKRVIRPISEDSGTDALANWRGVIQTMKMIHQAPKILREEALKKLRGQQNWPTNAELKTMADIHAKELGKNPALSRENPGSEFMAKFDATLEEHRKAAEAGTRPKSTAQRSRQQNEEAFKVMESLTVKSLLKIQLGDIDAAKLADIDKLCLEFEKAASDEVRAKLLSILTSAPAPTV